MNVKVASMSSWFFWHILMAFTIILIPSQIKGGDSYWNLPDNVASFLVSLFLAYISSVILLGFRYFQRKKFSISEILLLPIAVFCIYFFYLLMVEAYYSRTILLAASTLAVISIILSFTLKPKWQIGLAILVTAFTATLQALENKPTHFLINFLDLGPKPLISKKIVGTSHYQIQLLSFQNYFQQCDGGTGVCHPPPTGGGISEFGNGYLLSSGEGKLRFLTLNEQKNALDAKSLSSRVPINEDTYRADLGHNIRHTFRVTDILVLERGSEFDLFAAHHFWKSEEQCGVLRVSKTTGNIDTFLAGNTAAEWETLYETSPCLPAEEDGLTRGSESGGRLAQLRDGNLILTAGDHEYDGIIKQPMMAQEPGTSYGKILLINPTTGASEVYSSGHRNPQGLYVDKTGTIWSTEHGPRGGDEFNIVERGANYGWPLVTYGTQYGMLTWPLSGNQGRHDGYKEPLFAWVNSIAISNLYRLDGKLFSLWRNDFLIASLKKKLYRLRLVDGRVTFVEPIAIPYRTGRIRDLLEDKEGRVVLYMDDGSVTFLRPISGQSDKSADSEALSPEMRGQYLFMACTGCHKIADGYTNGIGPDLLGIVGKKIAGNTNFNYSEALSNISGTWTKEMLDQFLKNPQKMVPGTTMAVFGIPDETDRKLLIQYLENQK